MQRTVNKEFATFLTQAGAALMGKVLRGEATISFDQCQVGSGLWAVTKNEEDNTFTLDVPEQLVRPIDNGLFDIDALTVSSSGVTEARANVPPSFGPATITEVAWLLKDGTVYAITRYAALPVMPPESGNSSEVSLRAFLKVGDVSAVTLIVESGITASRKFVEEEVAKVDAKTSAETLKLTQQMSALPVSYLVTKPLVTGDAEQSYGSNISLSVSGGVSAWHNTAAAATIDHYEWLKPDGTLVNGANLMWPIPNDASLVDTEYQFKVRAIDSQNHPSQWVVHTAKVVGNRRPIVTGFAHTVPAIAIKNQVVSVAFSGATDPDGDDSQITYRITNPINLVASKSNDIVAGVALDLTFADVAQNSSAGITVVAVDGAGIQSAPQVITVDLRKLAVVVKPSGLAPTNNASAIARQPQIAGSAFATNPAGFAVHSATKIRVATDQDMTAIVLEMTLGAVTSAQLSQALQLNTAHWYQLQYGSAELGFSSWSEAVKFTTVAAELPQNVFATTMFKGSNSELSINNGLNHVEKGGLEWLKCIEAAYDPGHNLYSAARGVGKRVSTDSVAPENFNDGPLLTATGFKLRSNSDNISAKDYVSWGFCEAAAFLKIVTYDGDGVHGRKLGHDLGTFPGFMVIKRLDQNGHFRVWHRGKPDQTGVLSTADQFYDVNNFNHYFGGVAPTDKEFTVGNDSEMNALGGKYEALLFAHDPSENGIIQCGAANFGEVIPLGWDAQFVLGKCVKKMTAFPDMNWWIEDNRRGWGKSLMPNLPNAEWDSHHVSMNNGKLSMNNGSTGDQFIYVAIRAPLPV